MPLFTAFHAPAMRVHRTRQKAVGSVLHKLVFATRVPLVISCLRCNSHWDLRASRFSPALGIWARTSTFLPIGARR
jgi:hypothetical protein